MPDIVIMFFVLGLFGGIAKSDLKVPQAAYDTLSILLMLTLGLKGGLALHGHVSWQLVPEVIAILLLGSLVPLLLYPVLTRAVGLNTANAASIAAHYGSASAGTFAVALAYAEYRNLPIAPQTTLYLVLLELPAIIVGILLHRHMSQKNTNAIKKSAASAMWHEALTSKGVLLLVGGVVIGFIYGPEASHSVTSVFVGAFKALLALFLLEMGRCASQYLYPLPIKHWRVAVFALCAPLVLSFIGILIGMALQLPTGSILIVASLAASSSYIAAPAAIGSAIKDADIGLAVFASLGVTFPFNVLIGIPLYWQFMQWLML